MYKILILLCFLSGILNAQAEVKIGYFSFDGEGIRLGLEHRITDIWSASLEGNFRKNFSVYRLANKAYIDKKGLLNSYVGIYANYNPRIGRWASGFLIGAKLKLSSYLFLESEYGLGRWLDDNEHARYFKFDLGCRINWKKEKGNNK